MDRNEGARLASWTGPGALLTLVLASIISRPFGNLPHPDIVVDRLRRHRLRILLGTWLESLGAAILLAFTAGLTARNRALEAEANPDTASGIDRYVDIGGVSPAEAMTLAGGIGAGVLVLGHGAAVAAATERAGREGASVETATAAIDLGNILVGKMAPMAMALMVAGTLAAERRSPRLPGWLRQASAALLVGLASPLNFVFIIGGFGWAALIGLAIRREADAAAE